MVSGVTLEFSRGEFGWYCDLSLPSWAPFRKSGAELSAFVVNGAESPTPDQLAALEDLVLREKDVFDSAFSALRAYYDKMRPKYLPFLARCEMDVDVVMPPAPDDATFASLYDFQSIVVQDESKNGRAFLSFLMPCEWEVEHGIGIVAHGTDIVDIDYISHVTQWSPRR